MPEAQRTNAKRVAKGKHDKTVAEIIVLRIDWMQQLERKADGEMRPRIESWRCTEGHLRRLVEPKLGKMIGSDVTRQRTACSMAPAEARKVAGVRGAEECSGQITALAPNATALRTTAPKFCGSWISSSARKSELGSTDNLSSE